MPYNKWSACSCAPCGPCCSAAVAYSSPSANVSIPQIQVPIFNIEIPVGQSKNLLGLSSILYNLEKERGERERESHFPALYLLIFKLYTLTSQRLFYFPIIYFLHSHQIYFYNSPRLTSFIYTLYHFFTSHRFALFTPYRRIFFTPQVFNFST